MSTQDVKHHLDASTRVLKPHWFRSSYTQAFILGLASFCCPGIWGAMANLGAGGLQSAATGNAATSVTFGLMVFTCLLGPALLGKFGPRVCLILGTMGYAPYAAGLFCNSKFGTQWGVIFGAACCGVSAGIFWATEGTLIIAYPEPERRGRAISLWFGSVIGGAINLALNARTDRIGGISVNTYAVFVAIQCLGPAVALLISAPSQVQRTDSIKPILPSNQLGFWGEIKETVALWKRPRQIVFAIMFIMTQWGPGSTGFYLATYFTVRSRALSSLVSALLNQSCIWALGAYSDNTRFSVRFRAITTSAVLMAGLGASWIIFIYNQHRFVNMEEKPVFDWTSPGFALAWVPIVLNSLTSQLLYNWLYWVVSFMATGEEQSRQISTMRSVESLSSCLSYAISSANLPVFNVAVVNIGIYAIAIYPVYNAIQFISQREADGLNELPDSAEEPISPDEKSLAGSA